MNETLQKNNGSWLDIEILFETERLLYVFA